MLSQLRIVFTATPTSFDTADALNSCPTRLAHRRMNVWKACKSFTLMSVCTSRSIVVVLVGAREKMAFPQNNVLPLKKIFNIANKS